MLANGDSYGNAGIEADGALPLSRTLSLLSQTGISVLIATIGNQ